MEDKIGKEIPSHIEGDAVPHVLLLTGTPGVGKTTVIRRVAAKVSAIRLRGFCTEEIREHGARKGFRLIDFDGKERILAHVNFPNAHRVGNYGVDVEAIDEAAARLTFDPAVQLYLVDEIGKMECLSSRFVDAIRVLSAGKTPMVATVGQRGGGFIAEIKRLKQSALWQVTRVNRDALPSQILAWLRERGFAPNAADPS